MTITLSADKLLAEAAKLKIKKETIDGRLRDYSASKKNLFKGVDNEDFLVPSEKQHIIGILLNELQAIIAISR